ncbi:DUF4239 domain-containing protein [Martelella mediterranea]|uniref:Uncharacterized protein DUF4239 n=1 Tax=Martelella mediterranea TaxID=293089 RepID=A0A4V2V4Z3_9HYPH|nr:DUF4239 domain-containing protein [Martelella mediterranea]TCT45011.1 uncharacterized protein DUF4239 [Martelella mediterranea]
MSFLFGLPLFLSIILFIFCGVALYGIAHMALALLAKVTGSDSYAVPIGAFTGTVATAWALSLGFVAADIWALNAQADRGISAERSAIQRLIGNAGPEVLNSHKLEHAVKRYQERVVRDEWQTNKNLYPARSVERSLQSIRIIIMDIARGDAPQAIIAQTVSIFDDLQEARSIRLAIANTTVDQYKWYMLISLTLLTTFAIAAVHADRVRAGRMALTLYVMTATLCLWILVIHANPYAGVEQIQASSLEIDQSL